MKFLKQITSFVLFTLLSMTNTMAQGTGLYTEDGALRFNNAYKVDTSLLKRIRYWECIFLEEIFNSIEYPKLLLDNNVQGFVVAQVDIFKLNDSVSCKIVSKSFDVNFDTTVVNSLLRNKSKLLWLGTTERPVSIYIPFQFVIKVEKLSESLRSGKAIQIYRKKYTKCSILH
ncbi:hypothetical protein [Saccharicrinis sp. FJH54]|uniref:hypothetical protein n=1 Tax=Saccharicrinis sp. FJH54 TaxID=3344665 RepID=UPI0035D48FAD